MNKHVGRLQQLNDKLSRLPKSDSKARANIESEIVQYIESQIGEKKLATQVARTGAKLGLARLIDQLGEVKVTSDVVVSSQPDESRKPVAPDGIKPPEGTSPAAAKSKKPGEQVYGPPGGIKGKNIYTMSLLTDSGTEADVLTRKAEALSQAAAKVKEAGIADLAHDLHAQAEKLKAEAARLRSKPQATPASPDGSSAELQRSIHELHEQVQHLRKEIGELRELLQRQK